jgi:GGDEF domain-containing protein
MEQLHLEVSSTFDEVLRVRELEARRRGEENRVWLREVQARAQDIAQELDQAKRMMEELRAASDRERASAEENKKVNSVM